MMYVCILMQLLCVPLTLFMEGRQLPELLAASVAKYGWKPLAVAAVRSGVAYYAYNEVAYICLDR